MRISWIHLSDFHFGQGRHIATDLDRKSVLRCLLQDVELVGSELGVPDYVFITGDVAHSGKKEQFDEAWSWLDELAKRLRIGLDRMLLVPGNHDVDRELVRQHVANLVHKEMRRNPPMLSDLIQTGEIENVWPKLRAYQAFSTRGFGAPKIDHNRPGWRLPLADEPAKAFAVGLNTVLQSYDDEDDDVSGGANLQLSAWQLEQTLGKCPDDALILALAHHPPDLLSDGEEFVARLSKRPHLLIYGHVHRQGAFATLPLGQQGQLRLVAGAGHTAGGERTHAYAWGTLDGEGFTYFPRQWSQDHRKFLAPPLDLGQDEVEQHESLGSFIQYPRGKLPRPLAKWIGRSTSQRTEEPRSVRFDPLPFPDKWMSCRKIRRIGSHLCDLVGRYQYDPDVLVAVNHGGLVVAAAMMKVWQKPPPTVGCVFCRKRPGRRYEISFASLPGKPDRSGRWRRDRPSRVLVIDTKFKSGGSAIATYEYLHRIYGDGVDVRFALILTYGGWLERWKPRRPIFPWPAELLTDRRILAYIAFYTDKTGEEDDVAEPFRPGWPNEP